jgi:hypothetical protein
MFTYRSRFLTRGEVWYDEEPDATSVDWVYHRQRSSPLVGARCRHAYTLLIDLTIRPDQLLAGIEERTALKIIAAQNEDRLQWQRLDSRDVKTMDRVEAMWNEFAVLNKTPLFERDWVDEIARAGQLECSAASDPAGNVLAYHLVLLAGQRARQLIAIAPYRAVPDLAWRGAVSRANCFIHWMNFLAFRERGIPCFDFGGWYMGTTNIQFLGINRFKKSFGGRIVREFDCEEIRTIKGRVVLSTARLLKRAGLLNRGEDLPASAPRTTYPNSNESPKDCEVSPAF